MQGLNEKVVALRDRAAAGEDFGKVRAAADDVMTKLADTLQERADAIRGA